MCKCMIGYFLSVYISLANQHQQQRQQDLITVISTDDHSIDPNNMDGRLPLQAPNKLQHVDPTFN